MAATATWLQDNDAQTGNGIKDFLVVAGSSRLAFGIDGPDVGTIEFNPVDNTGADVGANNSRTLDLGGNPNLDITLSGDFSVGDHGHSSKTTIGW